MTAQLTPGYPPHDADAEQAVLGALLLIRDPDDFANACDAINPDDFYFQAHRDIYAAIVRVRESGEPLDVITLGAAIPEHAGYLVQIASATASAANITSYIDIVRDRAARRSLIESSTIIATAAHEESLEDAYAVAVSRISAVQARLTHVTLPPVDLFDDIGVPAIDPAWLPPHLSDFVFECSAVKGSPPEILALASLVACSAACHDQFTVQPRPNEPGWRESARLWGMIVADPSAKKTPAMKLAVSPLSDLNYAMVSRYATQRADYDAALKVFNAREKKRIAAEANGDGAPESERPPEPPRQERVIVNDATIEKLADLLSSNPRGMMYYNDELAGWFAAMDIYAKGGSAGRDRAYWLKFYDGGRQIIDRMSRPPTIVDNGSIRILGAIQPERIRSLSQTMDDDGLLQRFIVCVVPTATRTPADTPEPTHLVNKYKDIVTQLWNTSPGDGHTIVQMSPEAYAIQQDMTRYVESLVGSEAFPAMLRSHLSKWSGLFPRLCLTYHMIGCAATRKYPASIPIQAATAERVSLLMRRWILPNSLAFYTGLVGQASPAYELARSVGNFILAKSLTRVSKRDLTLYVAAWRSAPEWKQKAAMSLLEQSGWLLSPTATDGARKPAWPVNPRVHVDFAARAAKCAANRALANRVILEAYEKKARQIEAG